MKRLLCSICICLILFSKAQGISHVVKAGENLSTIANQYKVSVANIAAVNKININALLKVGQKLIIPTGNTKPIATTKPVLASTNSKQHVVVAGETLGKIARLNGVTEKDLMAWNNLKSDLIKIGQVIKLTNQGVVAKKPEPSKPVTPKLVTTTKTVDKNLAEISKEEIIEEVKPLTPIITKPVNGEFKPTQPAFTKQEEAPKKNVEAPKPIVASTPVVETPKNNTPVVSTNSTSNTTGIVGNSFFEQDFRASGVSNTLNCKSFKTAAGWQDKKYYALTNLVEAGTIIKITANNKTTYVKVLGVLPDTNNNTEIPIRISSATAQQLGLDFNAISQVVVEY